MPDLLTQSAAGLLKLLAEGELSAEELALAHIRRIEAHNPTLNALIDFDPERVLAQARALDRSQCPRGSRGPLHGLPLTIKASIAVAGHRVETGSLLHRDHRPAEDAEVVRRLRQAGAVILGTTNCPEFLMAYESDNRLYGPTANPWDLSRTAGGSSGGESAAIAAGLSAGGLGSDGGGSVRIPAHFTGICSLKPTPGRVPNAGHLPETAGPFSLLGVIGPMARTIADVELLFRVVSGRLATDPLTAPVEYRPASPETLRQTPIGSMEDDGLIPVTEETRQAVRDAAQALRESGFRVEPFRPPSLEDARQLWYTLFVRCGAMRIEGATAGRESELSPVLLDFLAIAHRQPPLSGDQMLAAWCEIDRVRAQLLGEMQPYPILLSPACSIPAFRFGERSWRIGSLGSGSSAQASAELGAESSAHSGGQSVDYLDAMRFAQWHNLLGSPAAVVPVGRSPEGLPIGVQIAGLPWWDEHVLGVSAVLDRAFGYRPPPMFD